MINAIVFPGQGSQRVGMAMDFVDAFEVSRAIFERASEALAFDVEALCRVPDDRLNLTEFTQPCILAAEIAMFMALRSEYDFEPTYFAGHSCGEYAALVAAGAMPLETALRLVHIRGKLMQWAAPVGFGGMLAVVDDEKALAMDDIEGLAEETAVDLANDNSPFQIVVSGEKTALGLFEARMKSRFPAGSIRFVTLATSAPFHSRHMLEAQKLYRKAVAAMSETFDASRAANVLSNTTGTFHRADLPALQSALIGQVAGRVRWRDNMDALIRHADEILELGPNRPLGGFFRAMGHEVRSVMDLRSARRVFAKVAETQRGGLYATGL